MLHQISQASYTQFFQTYLHVPIQIKKLMVCSIYINIIDITNEHSVSLLPIWLVHMYVESLSF